MSDNTIHAFDKSTTQKITGTDLSGDKRALDVYDHATAGPASAPPLTDFISGVNSGSNFIITYKSGGSGGTVLKTLTFNKNGCPFELAIT